MAWRGLGQDNIWVSTSKDGLNWTAQKELTDRASTFGPSLAGVDGHGAVMAWRGLNQANIWVSTSKDGINWSPQKELKDRASQSAPAICGTAQNSGLYAMIWRGLDQNNLWVSNSKDGLNWSAQKEITTSATVDSPGITHSDQLDGGVFYAGWHGLNAPNNPDIFVSESKDGLTYTPQADTKMKSQNGPALTPAGGGLLMAFRGADKNNIFVSNLNS
jgi:hypothetical protein